MHIGRRLRVGRKAAGLTQQGVGDALGLTFQQVQKYEQGQNRISASALYRISALLGLPVDFFIEGLNPHEALEGVSEKTNADRADWRNSVRALRSASDQQDLADACALMRQTSVRRRLAEIVAELTGQR